MRRLASAAFLVAVTVASVVPANAAPVHAQHFKFRGDVAFAEWLSSSKTSETLTVVEAGRFSYGQELLLVQQTANYDASGNFVGGSFMQVDTSSFSFTIDEVRLSMASISGSALPAQTCIIDADFNYTCTDIAIDLQVDWTGYGKISRELSTFISQSDGFRFIEHFNGLSRDADVTATIDGTAISGQQTSADIGARRFDTVDICIGPNC
jgi:hypothetical protein